MVRHKLIDLLYELMKDSKRSDRELAKIVGASQPTITRMRKALESLEYIREYTVIPALDKLGFELLSLNFITANITSEFKEWITNNPKILFATFGRGFEDESLLIVSIHKDFTDFSEFTREIRNVVGSGLSSMKSFLSSVKVDLIKPFSMKNFGNIQPKTLTNR
ncbi:MAG: Lrp/AsnC family transcriptional regulator [Candidatus Bathyarchaeia archaeon]